MTRIKRKDEKPRPEVLGIVNRGAVSGVGQAQIAAPFAVKGHSFVLVGDNVIGGKFVYEDALELVKLLNSPSP
jgi:hypothetical protein